MRVSCQCVSECARQKMKKCEKKDGLDAHGGEYVRLLNTFPRFK